MDCFFYYMSEVARSLGCVQQVVLGSRTLLPRI